MASNGTPTKQELDRVRKQLLVDKGPSARQQSYQFVYWRQLGNILGQPFDATKIPMSKVYQMRRDPTIAFGLHFVKVPMIRAPWYIKCDNAQVAAFVDWSLRRIYARLVLQYMQSLDFGFAAMVKRFELVTPTGTYIDPSDPNQKEKPIWSEGNVDPVVWKTFVGLAPEMVEPVWTNSGEFNGIRYDTKKDIPLAFPTVKGETDDQVEVPLNLSLWVTNEKDSTFGSPWGYPRLGYAFRYWWSYWYRWALADRHFEKDADPPAVVRYPDDPLDETLDDTGQPVDYREIALGIGEQMRSGSTIAMPSNIIETHFDGRHVNVPMWDIKFLEGGGNFEAFDNSFDRLEVLKLRAIWVPEEAFVAKGGTAGYASTGQLQDAFHESQAVLMAEFDDHLNSYVIPQLVQQNFPEFKGEAIKVTGGFGTEDLDLQRQLIQLIGNRMPEELPVDVKKILERSGVPVLSPEEIKRKQEEAASVAAAAGPPQIDGVPGKQAGTTPVPNSNASMGNGTSGSSTGFTMKYYQPGDRIELAADENFKAGLPDSRHYTDDGILAMTRENRQLWNDSLANAYNDFANFIGHFNFADDGSGVIYLDAKDVPNKPGVTNWVEKAGDLPKFIGDIAGDLITERGFTTSRAIATAVSRCKRWAAGLDGVSKKTQAKAAAAIAEWERKKASTHTHMADEIDLYIALAEDDPEKKAEEIVKRWDFSFGTIKDRASGIVSKIMERAGNLELRRAKFSTSQWDFNKGPADWAQKHAAALVSGVDNTTRNELKFFLVDEIRAGHSNTEIANNIRDHFSQFPGWRADRVARTETMLAYNYATLFAGEQAGVTRVQAIDAQKGPTDSECEVRNGKIFDISDAMTENIREHPNGTLGWRLLRRTNLSVQSVPREEIPDSKLAWYDPSTDTIYMAEDIDPGQAEQYLMIIGDKLCDE